MRKNPLAFFFTEKELTHLFPTKNGVNYSYLYQKFVWQEDKKSKEVVKTSAYSKRVERSNTQMPKAQTKNQNKHVATVKCD